LRARGVRVIVLSIRPRVKIAQDVGLPISLSGIKGLVVLFRDHTYWILASPGRYASYLGLAIRAPVRDIPFMVWAPTLARVGNARHVHTHFSFQAASVAAGVARLLGVNRTVTTHANDIYVHERFVDKRLRGARVITISHGNARFLALRHGIQASVVHCGVDVTTIAPGRQGEHDFDIIFLGRLVQKKGAETLLRALPLLNRAEGLRVGIVGDGILAEDLKALAARCGVASVEFVGPVDRAAALALMSRARLVCLPARIATDGDIDGIPVVLMEAMALGVPVVTTRVGGIPELASDSTAWLVPAGLEADPEALALALEAVLTATEQQLQAKLRGARLLVEAEFSLESQVEGLLDVISGS
jgi:colanic acid/amylovoran biosynthesis glycosyltransferase